MANYPKVSVGYSVNRPRYVSANNGQAICSRVTLNADEHKINSFSVPVACGSRGYNDGSGTCGGAGRNLYGAIWLSKPTSRLQAPSYKSNNRLNSADGGTVVANKGTYRDSYQFNSPLKFNFTDVVIPGNVSSIWVGIISDPYEQTIGNPDNTSVFFAGERMGSNTYECVYTNYLNGYRFSEMWKSSSGNLSPLSFTNVECTSPYTAPSIGGLTITPSIGRYNGAFTYHYSISKGTNNLSWVHLDILDSNGNYLMNTAVRTGFGNRADNITNTLSPHTNYRGRVAINDGKSTYHTNEATFKTYTEPGADTSISSNLFSPQDNARISWNCAVSQQTDEEVETSVSINGQQFSTAPSGTIAMSVQECNKFFSSSERSASRVSSSLNAVSTNKTSGATASSSKSFTIQYQPTKTPTSVSVSNSGRTIIIQDYPRTDVTWAYPHTSGAAGWVSGYILRVYTDSSYSNQYGSDIVITNSTAGSGNSASLNNATQLRRGKMNYLKITPYYAKPDGSGKIEGTQSAYVTLVKPVYRLNTPTIDYPINNSQWHNKHFRILLQLPTDQDLSYISTDYDVSSNSYKYQDIQVRITPNNSSSVTYSFTTSSHQKIFSTTNMYHNRKIAIKPSELSSFVDSSEYTIEIRCRKQYYDLSESQSWSNWSSPVVVKNIAVNRQTFIQYETEIKASQYMYVRNASVRLYNTYPIIKPMDSRNVIQVIGDQIDYSEYAGIYKTILDIRDGVNGYCTYDNTNIRFNETIDDFTLNSPKQEFITAADSVTETDKVGRNYKNLLVDDMNKLK